MATRIDWYENRNQLKSDMIFEHCEGHFVKLDRPVPGDGTKWYVANHIRGAWFYDDDTAEPGDLLGDPLTKLPHEA